MDSESSEWGRRKIMLSEVEHSYLGFCGRKQRTKEPLEESEREE